MNWKMAVLVTLAAVTAGVLTAAEPSADTTATPVAPGQHRSKQGLDAAKAAAGQKWKDVRDVKPIASSRLKKLLPQADFFCVAVFNPMSQIAGRPTFLHTLVLAPTGNVFLENDDDACGLLSKLQVRPVDAADALNAAMAFGELRNLVLRAKDASGIPEKAAAKNWSVVIDEEKDGWSVRCTFMTDPTIQLCRRYQIVVAANGKIEAKAGEVISFIGGYD